MAELNVDTVKMKECGKDIMNLSVELNEVLIALFERINNINNTDYIDKNEFAVWVGEGSKKFVEMINREKNDYFILKSILYEYGKYLVESSEKLNSAIESSRYNYD